jgi:hypothetical protein
MNDCILLLLCRAYIQIIDKPDGKNPQLITIHWFQDFLFFKQFVAFITTTRS